MICGLCRQEKPLQRESHIIPDFMYADIYDEHHKLHRFAPAEYIEGNRRVARPSSGEYESDILCQTCDNAVIGKYETYGSRALYADESESPNDPTFEHGTTETGIPVTRVTNLDYQAFKLFLLSILWKASISGRPFFADVRLGPYEEQIRRMILDGNPGRAQDFPVLLLSWLADDSMPHDFVGQPGKNRATNGIRYVFPIAGITYLYHVSPNSMVPGLMPFTLFPSNVGSILYVPRGKGRELFSTYFGL
ncbi:MAG: hypothetical protein Q8P51_07420 [Ignavibacteria bacterium]|nr:hypothetical protein [Ignavibacteria bacterium]